jgi:hypothetical protein
MKTIVLQNEKDGDKADPISLYSNPINKYVASLLRG